MSTSNKHRLRLGVAAGLATLGATFAAVQGCVSLAPNNILCPPQEDFELVSTLLEQRCGTLDCHGNTARPLRIYGQFGLRYNPDEDPEIYSGNLNAPTTDEEILRNYYAVCGLEPEKMTIVQAGEATAESLTLLRKPRLTERHKGGRIWDQGKEEDRCLESWISEDEPGEYDEAACLSATD